MAQHDFVPAWLNFSKPLPTKSPGDSLERHGERLSRGDARSGVSRRRRHNSSDGFFNNDILRAPAGNGWQQPALMRHDSVDLGVARGVQTGSASGTGGPGWKETPSWHSGPWGQGGPLPGHHPKRNGKDRERERRGAFHQRNGNLHPRKGEEQLENKLKFVEEDFPSLNPEMKPVGQMQAVGTPTGAWENPPSTKQTRSKMLVIKKVSKEDSSASFSNGFANTGSYPTNCTVKVPLGGPSVFRNLGPKPATGPVKTGPWNPNGRETRSSLMFSSRDSAFPSPASVTKPPTPVNTPTLFAFNEPPSSVTPHLDAGPSHPRPIRRSTDRKSEFLRGLKDSDSPPVPGEGLTPEPKDYEGLGNGISLSLSDSDRDHLSSSLEEEHRLLKAMGWQEHPENDDNFLPLTEEELKEFQAKTEQLKRNGWRQNDVRVVLKPREAPLPLSWRDPVDTDMDQGSDSDTSSSQTSDDDADA